MSKANCREIWKMVELDETSSDQIIGCLEDWEHIFQAENIDFEELGL